MNMYPGKVLRLKGESINISRKQVLAAIVGQYLKKGSLIRSCHSCKCVTPRKSDCKCHHALLGVQISNPRFEGCQIESCRLPKRTTMEFSHLVKHLLLPPPPLGREGSNVPEKRH